MRYLQGMQHYLNALWHGMQGGAAARDRAGVSGPQTQGYTSSIAQALYWLGFEIANVIVHGARA